MVSHGFTLFNRAVLCQSVGAHSEVAMRELNKLMRSKLEAFASREVAALKEANSWSFRKSMAAEEAEDNVITLGCFIPGGSSNIKITWTTG